MERGGSNRCGGWETRAGIRHAMWTTDVFGRTLTSMPSLTGAVSRDGRCIARRAVHYVPATRNGI
jgi:hypothetical protein